MRSKVAGSIVLLLALANGANAATLEYICHVAYTLGGTAQEFYFPNSGRCTSSVSFVGGVTKEFSCIPSPTTGTCTVTLPRQPNGIVTVPVQRKLTGMKCTYLAGNPINNLIDFNAPNIVRVTAGHAYHCVSE